MMSKHFVPILTNNDMVFRRNNTFRFYHCVKYNSNSLSCKKQVFFVSLILRFVCCNFLRFFYYSTILPDTCRFFYSCLSSFASCILSSVFLFQCVLLRLFQLLHLVGCHVSVCVLSFYLFWIGCSSIAVACPLLFSSRYCFVHRLLRPGYPKHALFIAF